MNSTGNPKIFISYSWTSADRVIELAERLMSNGVEVILDKWDLKEGQDKYAFMEQSVNDSSIDKVLIICDKAYSEKADQREGGVGDETVIISPEIYGMVKQEKFVPVIFEKDQDGNPYRPSYIKSRIYIDLSTEVDYESNYDKLLRNLHDKPLYRKPALGSIPEWLENERVDLSPIRDLVKQIRGYTGGNETKADFLIRKCVDEFVAILQGFGLLEDSQLETQILKQIEESKPLRDLYIDFLEAVIFSGFEVGKIIPNFFERINNETHDATGKGAYREYEFEIYDFFIWETFICTTAVMIHYERFSELHQILIHTYFLRRNYLDATLIANNFVAFRRNLRVIESVCKPKSKNPNLFTLAGDILLMREKKPMITERLLVDADIVLCQLSYVFNLHKNGFYWFPHLCCYYEGSQEIWVKLESKEYCYKIMPLFGVSTIDSLKEKIKCCVFDKPVRYEMLCEYAPVILNNIEFEKIATLN